MRCFTLFIILLIIGFTSCTQQPVTRKKPKIVVGIVVDQMRWDYLYRYADLYGNDGFKRLMREGFNCQNTMVNYLPAYTAPGHSCIYTGSVPSIHGIAGNNWIDNTTGKDRYCVDDPTVHLAGDDTRAPSMSPATLHTTTITDELRLASNLRSKVYGVAIKDRGSILPAGHLANAAYWYNDKTGSFTTSTYYPNQNPAWLQAFNKKKLGDSMVKKNWKLLYDAKVYAAQSTTDANQYEKGFKGEKSPEFPHVFDTLSDSDRHAVLKSIPAGNTYSIMMAKACMEGEQLGMGPETDFMALSLSSTDYIGHQFAPNSMEMEDCYLRLDQDIAAFLKYLDGRYGKDNYLLFMTADHGGAHNATFLQDKDVPAGVLHANTVPDLNTYLKSLFGKDSIVHAIVNYQVFLNNELFSAQQPAAQPEKEEPVTYRVVRSRHGHRGRRMVYAVHHNKAKPALVALDREKVRQATIEWLRKRPGISYVIDMEDINKAPIPEPIKTLIVNGYNRDRSGDIEIILNPGWYDNGGKTTGTTHGTWNPYDTHIPLLWFGWHITPGETSNQVNMTDISATLAALLHIQMPNGCIGKPISELLRAHPKTDQSLK